MQLHKPHVHLTSICFSGPGSETSLILLKFLRFSAQLSGFSADFHRKSPDIIKEHPNNTAVWVDSVFQPSNQVATLVNISSTGTVRSWKMEINRCLGDPKSS